MTKNAQSPTGMIKYERKKDIKFHCYLIFNYTLSGMNEGPSALEGKHTSSVFTCDPYAYRKNRNLSCYIIIALPSQKMIIFMILKLIIVYNNYPNVKNIVAIAVISKVDKHCSRFLCGFVVHVFFICGNN